MNRGIVVLMVAAPGCAGLDGAVVRVVGEMAGSGVAVGPGRVVTAAHLIGSGSVTVARQVSPRRSAVSLGVTMEARGDVTVVSCDPAVHDGVLPLGPSPSAGDRLDVLDAMTWPPARVRCVAESTDVLRPTSRMDRVGPGLSGAPAIDSAGRLRGIVTATLRTGAWVLLVVVPAEELRWTTARVGREPCTISSSIQVDPCHSIRAGGDRLPLSSLTSPYSPIPPVPAGF